MTSEEPASVGFRQLYKQTKSKPFKEKMVGSGLKTDWCTCQAGLTFFNQFIGKLQSLELNRSWWEHLVSLWDKKKFLN